MGGTRAMCDVRDRVGKMTGWGIYGWGLAHARAYVLAVQKQIMPDVLAGILTSTWLLIPIPRSSSSTPLGFVPGVRV